jgi:hypothetical protein
VELPQPAVAASADSDFDDDFEDFTAFLQPAVA